MCRPAWARARIEARRSEEPEEFEEPEGFEGPEESEEPEGPVREGAVGPVRLRARLVDAAWPPRP
ncbi:hypothetical protein ACPCSP_12765 [Streptomyces cinereoruber]|uniref:hypothetical protein n=1 Tax=Streptomyces cinereoruber TaxID=67260 RepID=UPI003C2E86EE